MFTEIHPTFKKMKFIMPDIIIIYQACKEAGKCNLYLEQSIQINPKVAPMIQLKQNTVKTVIITILQYCKKIDVK